MKKSVLVVLGVCLALNLVLANSQPARAYDLPAPSVTPVSGDLEFTATPTAISKLPGIIPNDNGIILPVGFPSGTAQFMGEGMVVKGFSAGTATVCFTVPAAQSEWVGTIHQWKDDKWTRLPTTLNSGSNEDQTTAACTTIYGDGTYAMIMGFTGQPKVNLLPQCDPSVTIIPMVAHDSSWIFGGRYRSAFMGVVFQGNLPDGSPLTYTIFNADPAAALSGALSNSGTVHVISPALAVALFFNPGDIMDAAAQTPQGIWLDSSLPLLDLHFTIRVTTSTCYADVYFSQLAPN